ncbi:MAG: N-acetylmuramoyl-L-alanine amidase [Gemmatimonadetes bacterium]|nr:N-acetylmuramoyl-L-alanine amidase [Gemmatimonadota bacterium]
MRGRLRQPWRCYVLGGLWLALGTPVSGQDGLDLTSTDSLDITKRVVVIDAGHGGNDPGTTGISGVEEKDVALAVARELADVLSLDPGLEVHLTRDDDRYLAPWRRGEMAMEFKGRRTGVFVSLHANAMPLAQDSTTRGFEVYFLSEARTEHERRVAAMENTAPPSPGVQLRVAGDRELDGILKELMNLDAHHWSSVFAEAVRLGMTSVPNTRDLGVRQAPLAVITNSLMPGILVELGYLTNRSEESRLVNRDHQRNLAWGIADGIYAFFEQYPPGQLGGVLGTSSPPGK